jgi:O-antigen/teichoic acid export membrane protein
VSLRRNFSYNLIGAIIPAALSLVTVPTYLHMIGPERYGVLTIAWLLLGYFGLFDLGLGRATSFRIAALRDAPAEERADTFWAALSVNLAMGAVGAVALWIGAHYFFEYSFKVDARFRPEILAAVPFLAASVPIATVTGVLVGALQGREKFLETNAISTTSTVLFQLLPLALAWRLGPNLSLLLGAALTARLLSVVVMALRCHVNLTAGHRVKVKRAEIFTLLKYGGWVNLVSIFGPILETTDRFAIGAMLGATSVTIYTVPFYLSARLSIVSAAVTNALFPRLSAATPEEREALSERTLRTMMGLVNLPVLGGIFIMEPFLRLWIGVHVGELSAPVGRIALVGFWFNAFALVGFVRLQASGRPDIVSKFVMAQIPPYLVLLFLALKFLGYQGAALVFALRYSSDYFWLNWLSTRRVPNFGLQLLAFGVLVLAAIAASLWPSIMDWRWWASATGLAIVMMAITWWALPADIVRRIKAFDLVGVVRGLRGTRNPA